MWDSRVAPLKIRCLADINWSKVCNKVTNLFSWLFKGKGRKMTEESTSRQQSLVCFVGHFPQSNIESYVGPTLKWQEISQCVSHS